MKKNNQIFYEKDSLNNLNLYFKDLRKSKVITKEEEIILSEKIKNGDEDAVKSLVEANLKFVVTIAKEYQNQGLPINDLINEGNYGLLKAAKKFDHTMGFRFISYAVWWVRQSIINSLNENARTVRLPTNVINRLSNLNKEILKELKKYDNFNYENEELTNEAEHLGLSVYNQNKSLNDFVNDNNDELIDLIGIDEKEEDKYELTSDIKNGIVNILNILDEREKDIIISYFGLNPDVESMTLEAIGEKYNLTKERIRQIKESSLRKLRYNSGELYSLINE
jgi:RNA polymerase primary sigma factor